jgi:hypothetical protein
VMGVTIISCSGNFIRSVLIPDGCAYHLLAKP